MSVLASSGYETVVNKMKLIFLSVCCLASLVSARPDVSLGYHPPANYNSGAELLNAPLTATSYAAAPSGSATVDSGAVNLVSSGCCGGGISATGSSSSDSASLGYTSGSGLSSSAGLGLSSGSSSLGYSSDSGSSSSGGLGLSSGYTSDSGLSSSGGIGLSSSSGSLGYTSGAGLSSSTGLGLASGSSSLGYNSGIGLSNIGSNLALSDTSSGTSSIGLNTGVTQGLGVGQTQQYAAQFPQQAPIITKNFYVHSAPEDHDDQQIVRYVTIGRPTKNYRVVFINAPSSTSTKAKIIANVAPTEDRTAIYVLTKKSNDLDISADVVTPAPRAPIKPDVFFIRYKTPQEAVHAQHVIQAQYAQLGGTTNVANEVIAPVQSVIGSLSQSQGAVNTASTGNIQGLSQSQLLSQGSQDFVSTGIVPTQSQYNQLSSQGSQGGFLSTGLLSNQNQYSQVNSQGSQDFLSTGIVPNQSQFNQVNGGALLTNYVTPTGYYRY